MRAKHSTILLFLLGFLTVFAIAQGNRPVDDDETNVAAPPPASTAKPNPAPPANTPSKPAEEPKPQENEEEEEKPEEKPEEPTKAPPASETNKPEESTTKKTPPPEITGGLDAGDDEDMPSATTKSDKPAATIGGGVAAGDGLALPTLQRIIPVYPAPSVPSTNGAPFMQQSTLPEGTVFIVVGSALAFCALAIFAWRGIVAWSLHRSVQKASQQPGLLEPKRPIGGKSPNHTSSFYSAAPAGSTLSLNPLNPQSARKGSTSMPMTSPGRNPTPNSSLFFSPTAASNGSITGDQRRSAYLPAGYYPTSTPPVPTLPPGPHHFQSASISSSNLGRFREPSPPGSPMLAPERQPTPGRAVSGVYGGSGLRNQESHTSLSLPPQGRAPSAYLEDLFEGGILDHPQAQQGGSGHRDSYRR